MQEHQRKLTQECLIHSDTPPFQCLGGIETSIKTLQQFGEKGNVDLCDWEMVYGGPRGRGAGIFKAGPSSPGL